MWSLKGHQPEISTYGGRKRQHLIGTVEPLEGNLHVAFSEMLKALQFQNYLRVTYQVSGTQEAHYGLGQRSSASFKRIKTVFRCK